ncbi:class I SAM-dependent methyltransferase [Rubrivivax sp. A210]|uniref:class I SAM-dependent methyltransferase n=1 Tax=Rubrivivax sp. A210 TaxID=2772301 RepID=UPI0019186CE2|nr:methyltransferase domain-containing protein [Rubrivivax sp. A210]
MTREESIIELGDWLRTPPGQYLLGWEQQGLDQAVTDAFGFHALQLGLPELDGLRANRMPHRWVASDILQVPESLALPPPMDALISTLPSPEAVSLHCEFDALPFPDASIDLAVLPHALELARDPHHTLREVERVLVPEGRVVIAGFNPASLWGLRQNAGRLRRSLGQGRERDLFLPQAGDFIGYWRLRDWLRLLGFEVELGRFGCWRPPLNSAAWLERFAWMEPIGERWWPVLGALYFVVAVKRVRGMRLVGLVRKERRKPMAAPAVVANRRRNAIELEH